VDEGDAPLYLAGLVQELIMEVRVTLIHKTHSPKTLCIKP
jgi:hypothetical protein